MNPEQKKYYLLGLEDAVREVDREVECCEMELTGESLVTARYTLRNTTALILDLIEGVKQGL